MLAFDEFRAYAKKSGFTERKILSAETGFDWSELEFAGNNMSLFGDRILIDLRIPTGKPGVAGSKVMVNFIANLHPDVMLLVQAPKLDRNAMNSAWVKAINKTGAVLRVWPLNEGETRNWIKRELDAKGFTATNDIVAFITQQIEGNLLAAIQEIEKLSLLSETKKLDIQVINKVLINSSHYSLNELMEAITQKDTARLVRILNGLKNEDIAPPLVLWGLTEQIRKIAAANPRHGMQKKHAHQGKLAKLSLLHQQHINIWDDQGGTGNLLKQCAWTDQVIKGRANGDPWHELLQLSLAAHMAASIG